MKPSYPFECTALLELVGKDEQVDQNEFGAAVQVTDSLASNLYHSVEFTRFMLYMSEEASGAILYPSGQLLIFTANPGTAAGETGSNLTAAIWQTCIGVVNVTASDWVVEDAGAVCDIKDQLVQVHGSGTGLFFVWRHTDATSINSAGTDDEVMDCRAWYIRYD